MVQFSSFFSPTSGMDKGRGWWGIAACVRSRGKEIASDLTVGTLKCWVMPTLKRTQRLRKIRILWKMKSFYFTFRQVYPVNVWLKEWNPLKSFFVSWCVSEVEDYYNTITFLYSRGWGIGSYYKNKSGGTEGWNGDGMNRTMHNWGFDGCRLTWYNFK